MTAFIKYCGGCNETFSRAAAAARIKKAFSGRLDFFNHEENVFRDIGILIEGCGACCVVRSGLAPCGKLIEICSGDDVEPALLQIENML